MRNKSIVALMAVALFSSNIACGMSPLFNHRSQEDLRGVRANLFKGTCHFELKSENLCATVTWIKEPTNDDEGSFTLQFWQKETAGAVSGPVADPVNGIPFVKLWMPDMGHGSTKVNTTKMLDAQGQAITGKYLSTPIHFVMGGAWEIILQLKDPNGKVIDQSKIEYIAQ